MGLFLFRLRLVLKTTAPRLRGLKAQCQLAGHKNKDKIRTVVKAGEFK